MTTAPAPKISTNPRYGVPAIRGQKAELLPKVDSGSPESIAAFLKSRPRPWAIDIFSGAGGLSLGLEQAGFSVVAAADSDGTALATHRGNLPSLTWEGDLSNPDLFLQQLQEWGIDQVDLIAGGPPCQPFSKAGVPKISSLVNAGARAAKDPRRDLWSSFFRLIDELKPSAVLFENVPDFVRAQEGAVLVQLLSSLKGRGFQTNARVLEAWRYGVPQHRSRLFAVGIRGRAAFSWPEESKARPKLWDAIGDLPNVEGGEDREQVPYEGPPSSDLARELRKDVPDSEAGFVWDHWTRMVRDDDAEAFSGMLEGGNYTDIPERLRRYRSDIFDDKYHRLNRNELSRTITAHLQKDGYWYIHPIKHRTLSVREAARIQTFPDHFRFAGFPTTRFKQVGNAVPPKLARAVASSIRSALDGEQPPGRVADGRSFRTPLVKWFRKNRRGFPWRSGDDPWQFLVAEVCLQRTKAQQVADAYPQLAALAPSPQKLIDSDQEFLDLAASLGLPWRFQKLLETAHILVEKYEGTVPTDWENLRSLPGVGDYVASAVLCFGDHRQAVLLDTNTQRIARRLTGQPKLGPWQARVELFERSGYRGPDSEWNYALLDLAALVCTVRTPKCDECPVRRGCLRWRALQPTIKLA